MPSICSEHIVLQYGFYEKCGMRRVGKEIQCCETVPEDYDEGIKFGSIMSS